MEKVLGNVKKSIKSEMDVFITETSKYRNETHIMDRKYYVDDRHFVRARLVGNSISFAYYTKGCATAQVITEGTYGYWDKTWNKFRDTVRKWKRLVEEHTK